MADLRKGKTIPVTRRNQRRLTTNKDKTPRTLHQDRSALSVAPSGQERPGNRRHYPKAGTSTEKISQARTTRASQANQELTGATSESYEFALGRSSSQINTNRIQNDSYIDMASSTDKANETSDPFEEVAETPRHNAANPRVDAPTSTDDMDVNVAEKASQSTNSASRKRSLLSKPLPVGGDDAIDQQVSAPQRQASQHDAVRVGPDGPVDDDTDPEILPNPATPSTITVSLRKRGKKRKHMETTDSGTEVPKAETHRDQSSFRLLRFAIRLGLIPIASECDSFFLQELSTFIAKCPEAADGSDPFKDLRLLDGSVPTNPVNPLFTAKLYGKYSQAMLVRNELMSTAKGSMKDLTEQCFGDASNHEQAFAKFDAMEWCAQFLPRRLLFQSKTMLCNLFGKDMGLQLNSEMDFAKRADFGITILAILFSGMLAVFRSSWNMASGKSFPRYGRTCVSPELRETVFEKLGSPQWNRAWVRVLLMSLPAQDGREATPEEKTLHNVGVNLEYLCVLQLATVMHMEQNKLNNYRNGDLLASSHTLQSLDKGFPTQAIFRGSRSSLGAVRLHSDGKATQYILKSGGYPWNKVMKWIPNLRPITLPTNGPAGPYEKQSRYDVVCKTIRQERASLVSKIVYVKASELQNLRSSTKDATPVLAYIDMFVDMILAKGNSMRSNAESFTPVREGDKAHRVTGGLGLAYDVDFTLSEEEE